MQKGIFMCTECAYMEMLSENVDEATWFELVQLYVDIYKTWA